MFRYLTTGFAGVSLAAGIIFHTTRNLDENKDTCCSNDPPSGCSSNSSSSSSKNPHPGCSSNCPTDPTSNCYRGTPASEYPKDSPPDCASCSGRNSTSGCSELQSWILRKCIWPMQDLECPDKKRSLADVIEKAKLGVVTIEVHTKYLNILKIIICSIVRASFESNICIFLKYIGNVPQRFQRVRFGAQFWIFDSILILIVANYVIFRSHDLKKSNYLQLGIPLHPRPL